MCIDKDINYTNTDENRKLMKDILNIEKSFYENLTVDQRKQYGEITDLKALSSVATDRKIFIFAFELAKHLIL